MDTMADRIRTALALREMSPADLIRLKVLSKAGVYFLLDGTTTAAKVRADTVSKLCKALSVNREWLLSGRGPMDPDLELESQTARIDPATLAESIAALRQVAKNRGWSYDPETHPEVTIYAYELRAALPEAPQTADVIDFGARLAERLQQQQARGQDGQAQGRPTGEADRARARSRATKP